MAGWTVTLVPLAIYSVMGPVTTRGLLLRAALAAIIFGVCALCRSSCLSLLPGYALALAVGAGRLCAGLRGRSRAAIAAGVAVATFFLMPLPYVALSAAVHRMAVGTLARHGMRSLLPQRHDIWASIWQGLGGFDRTKGHVFLDMALNAPVRSTGRRWCPSPHTEAILRDRVFGEIRSDPVWYAGMMQPFKHLLRLGLDTVACKRMRVRLAIARCHHSNDIVTS